MTRSDLVEALAERFGQLTHRDAEYAVKTLLDAMSEALARGHRIELRGFGTFSVNRRPPGWGATPAPAKAWPSLRSGCRTSNLARPCARPLTWATPKPDGRTGGLSRLSRPTMAS